MGENSPQLSDEVPLMRANRVLGGVSATLEVRKQTYCGTRFSTAELRSSSAITR